MGYDVSDIYQSNSDFLRAEDIGANFWTATISAVDMKAFDNGERKLLLSFQELDKALLLNMTNARTVSDLYGGDTDGWINKQVMLFTMPVDYQGKKVQAIRLRGPASSQGAPQRSAGPNTYAQQSGGVSRQQYDERNPPPYTDDDLRGHPVNGG